jgi:hypothetical protein
MSQRTDADTPRVRAEKPSLDLESLLWIVGGQLSLLLAGGIGVGLLSAQSSHRPQWHLDPAALGYVAMFVGPLVMAGFLVDKLPGK